MSRNDNDDLDPLSRQIIADTIEMLSHCMLMESDDSESNEHERYDSINYFWHAYGDTKRHYGRLYCRYRLAKIFAASCIRDPYPVDNYDKIEGMTALAKWDRESWGRLDEALNKLRGVLLRKDAEWLTGESDENRGSENSKLFGTQFDKVLRLIPIHKALAPFRWKVEKQAQSTTEGSADVNRALVADYIKFVEENFENDAKARKALEALLHCPKKNNEGVSLVPLEALRGILKVKPFCLLHFQEHLKALLRNWTIDVFGEEPPILVRLGYHGDHLAHQEAIVEPLEEEEQESQTNYDEEDLEEAVHNSGATGKHVEDTGSEESDDDGMQYQTQPPECAAIPDADSLAESETHRSSQEKRNARVSSETRQPSQKKRKARTGSAKRENSRRGEKDHVANLRSVRTTLKHDFEDPLEETRKIAASAVFASSSSKKKRAKRNHTNDKKPSAQSLAFDTSDEDSNVEDSEEEHNEVKLSELPPRAKPKTPRQPAVVPDPPLLREDGTKRRRKFTKDEKNAIREGVRKLGFGKWAVIKAEYAIVLRNRTSVNIKDCYRTMMKNGEV